MKRRSSIAVFLKTTLAVAFILAGGSFSHSFADAPHAHVYAAGTDNGHSHNHVAPDAGGHVAEHETVHCGALLLALTADARLAVPDSTEKVTGFSFAPVASRVATIDPPPPRSPLLSI
ncbi:hypothetical protein [uncultured Roseibium sp.]|uniref:hypothetical protein n=1 Tax=uncultured Roseibium sp. TaxID=1936171 RepID=UPI0032173A63